MPQALISRQLYKLQQAVIFCLYLPANINYDNKIYTKILANQIRPTLEDIIGPELTAAIKGRTIIENLRLNRDVMSYANAHKIQAPMIALDQEKALDRVDVNFLFKALHHFGYGPEITQKIKTVYQNMETQTKVKRTLAASFSSDKRTAARMHVTYDSVHYICRNIFREYKTKQWHQRYRNRQKGTKNFSFCR